LKPEVFGEWLRRQGHRVVRTASSYWNDQAPHVYQAFPYHWLIRPSEYELRQLLTDQKAIGLRYSTTLDSPVGHVSYQAVYEGAEYSIESLGKSARKNVRRGLANCKVEPIAFGRLADEGWILQSDTLQRQGRAIKMALADWRLKCLSADDLEGFEAWGAIVGNRLAASVITFQMDDCCYMLYQQCHRDFLVQHVNNALSFVVTQTMLRRAGIGSILYGLHSLDAPPEVDEFKFRMGYTAKPIRQRVVFHPALAPIFNKATHSIVSRLRAWLPSSPAIAKAEGMLRFHIQGLLPIEQQSWPECLKPQSIPLRSA